MTRRFSTVPTDLCAASRAVFAAMLLAILALGPQPASAQLMPSQAAEKPAAEDGKVAGSELSTLLEILQDEKRREALVKQLQQAGAEDAQTGPEEGADAGASTDLLERLSDRLTSVGETLVKGAEGAIDIGAIGAWADRQISDPDRRALWVDILWKVLLVVVLAFVAEWIIRRLLRRTRQRIEERHDDPVLTRALFLLARTVLDVLPIAGFALAAHLAMPFVRPDDQTSLIALAVIDANVLVRAVMAVGRMVIVPRASGLRLLNLSDRDANYVFIWLRRFAQVSIYGYFLGVVVAVIGAPQAAVDAIYLLVGLLVVLLAIVLILQSRTSVAGWIGGNDDQMPGIGVFRRRLGDIWHVLAIVYVAAVYVIWALEIEDGFRTIFRGTALTFAFLTVAHLLSMGAQRVLSKGLGISEEVRLRFPGLEARANRYFSVLYQVVRVIIYVVAILASLEAWGLGSFEWLTSGTGRRVVAAAVTILIVAVGAIVLWEMVSSSIERYLASGKTGPNAISARAKTLLPLVKNVFMIVLAAIVIMVILSEIGLNIGPLLAGAGIVGLAVGFGAQTLVKDVITGFFILMEDQISVGDVVKVGTHAGLVEGLTIRTISLRDLSGVVHTIPFSEVTTVENMTKDFSRYVFDVGVAYREDVDQVMEVLREIGEGMQADEYYGSLITAPLEILGLDKFADSAVVIRARITTKPIKQWEVGREFNRRMKIRFDELGIEIPFPHRTLYFGVMQDGSAPPAYVETNESGSYKSALEAERAPPPKPTAPSTPPSGTVSGDAGEDG